MYLVNPKYLKRIVERGLVKYLSSEDFRDKDRLDEEPKLCPFCYSPIRPNARFCYECGTKL